jgi:hypothetical protein
VSDICIEGTELAVNPKNPASIGKSQLKNLVFSLVQKVWLSAMYFVFLWINKKET